MNGDLAADLRELSEPWAMGDRIKAAIGRASRLSGLGYSRVFEIWYGRAHGRGSRGWKHYSFRRTRTFIARILVRLGIKLTRLTEWAAVKIAPCLVETEYDT